MLVAWCNGAVADEPEEDEPPPTAPQIQQAVVNGLPRERLDIAGEIRLTRRKGFVENKLLFKSTLEWGAYPPRAVYTILDSVGNVLEEMEVTRGPLGDARFQYRRGDPATNAPRPLLTAPIQSTDLTWLDLTFSFLWWPDASLSGFDSVRGYDCYVIDVPVPHAQPLPRTALMRLWIARQSPILLKAEALDRNKKTVREMTMEGFKKINERWMVKEIIVRGDSRSRRTELKIHDVQAEAGTRNPPPP